MPALVWRFARPMRVVASTALGGGIGERHWILNAQVASDYARLDPAQHLSALARLAGCAGPGVGFLTAARVQRWTSGTDEGVDAYATVGLARPVRAAAQPSTAEPAAQPTVGTINVVVFTPVALSDSALVNAVVTATEAKTQALLDCDVGGTGTASDAVCVVTEFDGAPEAFCGPRSSTGAALARAVHRAVADGARAWVSEHGHVP